MSGAAPLPAPFPPPGYRRWRDGDRDTVAWEPAADAVRAALGSAERLERWAAPRAERTARGGRSVVYAARLGPVLAAVRAYHRGGWFAPLLGDRYLDRPPRPFRELAASEALRAAGVRTPRVVAAIAYEAHPGYRAEIATEWLEPGHDLVALLAPGAYPGPARAAALDAAGEAIGRAHRAGLDHPDLNLANVFVLPRPDGGWDAALLDLDRASIGGRDADAAAAENLARLERSIAKERRADRVSWTDGDRAALRAGWRRGAED